MCATATRSSFVGRRFCAALLWIFGLCVGSRAAMQQEHGLTIYEEHAQEYGWVRPGTGAGSPFGRYLLLRKGSDACAIRFGRYHRDYDAKPGGMFTNGAENMYGEYEWNYQGDGSFDFKRENLAKGNGQLRHGPTSLLGHGITLRHTPGKGWIECGPFKLGWSYPIGLSFWSHANGAKPVEDADVEMAPTKWSRLEEIDYFNPKLRWTKVTNLLPLEGLTLDQLP
jgi:hypothetical protein